MIRTFSKTAFSTTSDSIRGFSVTYSSLRVIIQSSYPVIDNDYFSEVLYLSVQFVTSKGGNFSK